MTSLYPPRLPHVMVRPRAGGKTTQSLEWLSKGERCEGYPGWTRVMVVPEMRTWQHTMDMARMSGLFDHPDVDLAHRIYFLEDWRKGRVTSNVAVLLDDVELMLPPDIPGRIAALTLSGQPVADGQWLAETPLPRDLRFNPAAKR